MPVESKIEKVLDQIEIEVEPQGRRDARRRAEELSDKFSDIEPKTDIPSSERFMGLPIPSKEKLLFQSESVSGGMWPKGGA